MATFLKKKNNAKSNLLNPVTQGDSAIVVRDAGLFPLTGSFMITVWNKNQIPDPSDDSSMEIMRVTSVSGNIFTVTRGQEGTVATTHNMGNAAELLFTVGQLEELETEIQTLSVQSSGENHWDRDSGSDTIVPFIANSNVNIGSGNLTTTGTLQGGTITIFSPTPILVFQDSNSLGAASVGYIEWKDSGGGRAGFFGNSTSSDSSLLWKNEQGGNIGIQTTGAGNLDIIANLAQFNTTPITTTGTVTAKGYTKNLVTKTGAYTLTASDDIVLGNTNAFTLTLPASSGITGKVYTIKKINTEYDEALTIDGNSSETIDGALTYVIYTVDSGITIISDGSNWQIIGSF